MQNLGYKSHSDCEADTHPVVVLPQMLPISKIVFRSRDLNVWFEDACCFENWLMFVKKINPRIRLICDLLNMPKQILCRVGGSSFRERITMPSWIIPLPSPFVVANSNSFELALPKFWIAAFNGQLSSPCRRVDTQTQVVFFFFELWCCEVYEGLTRCHERKCRTKLITIRKCKQSLIIVDLDEFCNLVAEVFSLSSIFQHTCESVEIEFDVFGLRLELRSN